MATALLLATVETIAAGTQRVGRVLGVVIDDRGPVVGAEVTLRNPRSAKAFRAVTDTLGAFLFGAVPAAEWTLDVRRLGYRAASRSVVVRDGADALLSVRLEPAAALDTVVVEAPEAERSARLAGFYERKARGRGRFFTRDEIAASPVSKLTEFLSGRVQGIRVGDVGLGQTVITFARCPTPMPWLSRPGRPNIDTVGLRRQSLGLVPESGSQNMGPNFWNYSLGGGTRRAHHVRYRTLLARTRYTLAAELANPDSRPTDSSLMRQDAPVRPPARRTPGSAR